MRSMELLNFIGCVFTLIIIKVSSDNLWFVLAILILVSQRRFTWRLQVLSVPDCGNVSDNSAVHIFWTSVRDADYRYFGILNNKNKSFNLQVPIITLISPIIPSWYIACWYSLSANFTIRKIKKVPAIKSQMATKTIVTLLFSIPVSEYLDHALPPRYSICRRWVQLSLALAANHLSSAVHEKKLLGEFL